MASHLKRKQATKGPDFGSRGTKSLKDLKVGKKKKKEQASPLQLSKAGSPGILPQLGLRAGVGMWV